MRMKSIESICAQGNIWKLTRDRSLKRRDRQTNTSLSPSPRDRIQADRGRLIESRSSLQFRARNNLRRSRLRGSDGLHRGGYDRGYS